MAGLNRHFREPSIKKDNDSFNLDFLKYVEEMFWLYTRSATSPMHDMPNLVTDEKIKMSAASLNQVYI